MQADFEGNEVGEPDRRDFRLQNPIAEKEQETFLESRVDIFPGLRIDIQKEKSFQSRATSTGLGEGR